MIESALKFTRRAALLAGSAAFLLAAQAGQAQQSRYSSDWRESSTPSPTDAVPGRSAELDSLLKELEKLTADAERSRAADPRFLADLRDLARRYAWPWHRLVVADSFQDGDFSQNPRWIVSSGTFTVGPGGLVTTAVAAAPAPEPEQSSPPQQTSDDFARQLLGGVLRELARDRNGNDRAGNSDTTPARQTAGEARIHLERQIPNRFAIRVEMQSRTKTRGSLEWGVGQGPGAPGYFLVYNAGSSPSLSLVRRGARGSAVVDAVPDRIVLEDGKTHVLLLTRDETGAMAVTLDGQTKFRVSDRAFRSAFDRFVLTNTGGDFTLRSVAIYGAP